MYSSQTHFKFDNDILRVVSSVGCQGLGDDEHGFGKCGNSHLGLALDGSPVLHQVLVECNKERAGTRNNRSILDGVLDRPEPVPDCVIDLVQGERVRPLDENSHTLGVLDFFDKCVLLLAQSLLKNEPSMSKNLRGQVVDRILGHAPTAKLQAFHIASLCPPQCNDVVLLKNVQAQRVDAFLVDDDEAFLAVPDNSLFKLDNFGHFRIDVLAFGCDQFFSFLGAGVEETRVDFTMAAVGC